MSADGKLSTNEKCLANLFKWLRGIGAIAEVRCDHHVITFFSGLVS